jgi:hypothetical protein
MNNSAQEEYGASDDEDPGSNKFSCLSPSPARLVSRAARTPCFLYARALPFRLERHLVEVHLIV